MRILISGMGVAGPSLAYWLLRYGFEPTIVEIAPALRTGGYVIDFWGAGFDVAERMGIVPELERRGYRVSEVRVENSDGKRIAGFSASAFDRVTRGRFVSLPRGDLASVIFDTVSAGVETIFGDSIAAIRETGAAVEVTFGRGQRRDFDLVIGADGLHSRVRELVFGPQSRFERYTGLKVAAFESERYSPRDELVYVMYTDVGRQIARFAMRGDKTMFLFTFRDTFGPENLPRDLEAKKEAVRNRYRGCGWEWPQIREALDAAGEIYFDRVSQIRMSSADRPWSRGRVGLVGDAAFCVSLLAGQGSALAMIAAYILAGELHAANGDYPAAFRRYEERFGPFVRGKQDSALWLASSFAPKSRFSLVLRNGIMNLLQIPWIASWTLGRDLADTIDLPDY